VSRIRFVTGTHANLGFAANVHEATLPPKCYKVQARDADPNDALPYPLRLEYHIPTSSMLIRNSSLSTRRRPPLGIWNFCDDKMRVLGLRKLSSGSK